MQRKVVKQIELLQGIKPRTEWVGKTRDVLLSQVTAQGAGPNRPSVLAGALVYTNAAFGEVYRFSLGPLVTHSTATALAIVSLLGGSVTAHFASQGAVPGDNLYAVKKTSEGIQAAIVSSADQAALRVEFSEKRLKELEELTRRISDGESSGAIAQLVGEVQQNLSAAKNHIALNEDKTPGAAAKIASLVGERAGKYQEVLHSAEQKISETADASPVAEQVAQAIQTVDETATVALGVAIEQRKTPEDSVSVAATLEAQVKHVQQKVEAVQNKVTQAVANDDSSDDTKAAQEQSQEAKKILREAEVSLAKKDFKLAFEQIAQSKELIAEAEVSLKKKGDINSQDSTKKELK